jgi:hypothetical protein
MIHEVSKIKDVILVGLVAVLLLGFFVWSYPND